MYLIFVIIEVSKEESLNRTVTVFHGSLPGSFASLRKVCFHCRCARIKDTNDISILSPLISEDLLKVIRKSLECSHTTLWLSNDTKLDKPCQKILSADDRLYNICSIQTIHTICSKDSLLHWFFGSSLAWIFDILQMKKAIILNLMLSHIQKLTEVFILHLLAFCVEVEPDKLKTVITNCVMHLLKIVAKSFLRPLFVNEVDKSTIFKVSLDVIIVFLCDLTIVFIIRVDIHFGAPFQVRILSPEERHGSSKLYIGEDILFASALCQKDNFCFSSIGCITIEICPSSQPSLTLSSFISSRNKCDLTCIVDSCVREINGNEPRDKSCNPLIGLYLDEVIDPVTVIHVAEPLVFHRAVSANEWLERVCQVILIRKVEIFAGKHIRKPLYIQLVIGRFLMRQAEKLYFLSLEYFAMIYLPDYWSFGNDNQIIIDLHFYYPINCLYRYFLKH